MKATQGTTFRTLQNHLSEIVNKMSGLQVQSTTGKRITKPSDDPAAIGPVLHSRAQIRQTDRYMETLGVAGDKLALQDTFLTGVVDVLTEVRDDVVKSLNGTLSQSDLNTIADEISAFKDELMGTINTQVEGKYIFSGYMEDVCPFEENAAYDPLLYDPANSATWPVIYQANDNPITLETSPGEIIEVTATGCATFLGDSDNDGSVDAGGVNLFYVLSELETAIRANDVPTIEANLAALDDGMTQVIQTRSLIGINAQRVDTSKSQMEDIKLNYQQSLSRYEDADLVETLSELLEQETAFQAALEVTSRVANLSILNYL
ncbi:MAG: flagellar hook-associated protein FlgL [Deltaproteobacteria bacterium]|nr:flagellar hook-associated protein FlgL [Deltaproteobacteria bacterium]